MQTQLVMTVIGRDRPGLVEKIAALVAEHDGNWLDSRMCHLGGEFAGILRVQLPAARRTDLERALVALKDDGLHCEVRGADEEPAGGKSRTVGLEIVGQDRPGIVREISRVLAGRGVNVEELHTERSSAPMSGETIFIARMEVGIPDSCDRDALREALERIASDLLVEIEIEIGEAETPA